MSTVGYAAFGPENILAFFVCFWALYFGILTEVKLYGATLQCGCCSSYRCNYCCLHHEDFK